MRDSLLPAPESRAHDCSLSTACSLCGSHSYSVLYPEKLGPAAIDGYVFSARQQPDRLHYRVVKCRKCGLVFSNPILSLSEIQRRYSGSTFTYEAEVPSLKDTYGRYLGRYMSYAPKSESLLEIGCGNGFFLEVALDLGFKNVCGVEPSYQAIAAASSRVRAVIRNEMFDPDSFGLTRFDVICFFQTVEHVSDPNQLLNGCHRLLRDRGLVLCIAHNVEAFPARVLGERSPIIDVQHTHLFGKTTLRRIFEKNGFDVIDVFDVHNLFSLKYLLHMAPLPTSLKPRLANLLRTSGIGDWRIRLSVGNIGIAALKGDLPT